MIKVSGLATLKTGFEVELKLTEEEWDSMSAEAQNAVLENTIDWRDACESAETDDIDVWDLVEIES